MSWSYSQAFQEGLSPRGSLSDLGARLFRGLRRVQGLPWCPPSLRDQKVPALQVDLRVRGGHARPWGRSLLMDPERMRMEGAQRGRGCWEKRQDDQLKLMRSSVSVEIQVCSMIGQTHLRSDDSRRSRWTHFTLETLEESEASEWSELTGGSEATLWPLGAVLSSGPGHSKLALSKETI
ncbi:hypothetical protein EYF80_044027 [Liparis tanakae]|uniref:Uncharacterized protein n=1 Tax=Liparis tanakae TaxID=230148 RepID=A0A4Z2FYZ8_9TELE|nr:hypothetical protein EYF80_044027 [Liparis tanakae]